MYGTVRTVTGDGKSVARPGDSAWARLGGLSPLSARSPCSALTRTTRSSCSDHRPIGKRSPPLVRAPPAMRSADAAHSLRARPGVEEPRAETPCLRAPPRPPPAERDRDAPSPPVVPRRRATGPPTVGLAPSPGRDVPCRGSQEVPPEARLSNPRPVSQMPLRRHDQTAAKQARTSDTR